MSGGGKYVPQAPVYAQPIPLPQDPTAIQTEADKAAEEVKKKARKASGRSSTIATSPLGVVSPVQPVIKSLLGQ